jgi:hypothetical protein
MLFEAIGNLPRQREPVKSVSRHRATAKWDCHRDDYDFFQILICLIR